VLQLLLLELPTFAHSAGMAPGRCHTHLLIGCEPQQSPASPDSLSSQTAGRGAV
jgi:hypothetical protein